jgi:cytochrome bd-type quinol oxidase subunit 2
VGIFIPIILLYQTCGYIVFRGKVGGTREATSA